MAAGFGVGIVGPGLISSTLGLVLKTRVQDPLHLAGMALGVATLSGVVLAFRWVMDGLGAPVLGALADRVRWELFVLPLFLLGAAALVLAGLPSGLTGLLAGVATLFFCGTFLGVLLTAWAGLEGPRTVAAYVTAQDFGSALGPLAGWTFVQFALPPNLIFLAGAGAYGLALVFFRAPAARGADS